MMKYPQIEETLSESSQQSFLLIKIYFSTVIHCLPEEYYTVCQGLFPLYPYMRMFLHSSSCILILMFINFNLKNWVNQLNMQTKLWYQYFWQ